MTVKIFLKVLALALLEYVPAGFRFEFIFASR